jgi:hypothetical protein
LFSRRAWLFPTLPLAFQPLIWDFPLAAQAPPDSVSREYQSGPVHLMVLTEDRTQLTVFVRLDHAGDVTDDVTDAIVEVGFTTMVPAFKQRLFLVRETRTPIVEGTFRTFTSGAHPIIIPGDAEIQWIRVKLMRQVGEYKIEIGKKL